jgi:hypothetical protein
VTKQEFIQQYQVSMRAETRRLSILGVITFIIMAPALALAPRIIDYLGGTEYFDWAGSFNEYSVRGIFGCFVIMLAFGRVHLSQPYGVPCPACGKKLHRTGARVALITCNCWFCGEKILEEANSGSADTFRGLKLYD